MNGIGSKDELYNNILIGNSWEGYVIYYYRTGDGSEIDLVFARGNKAIAAAEIKFTAAPYLSKGNHISMKDLKTKKNFILIPGDDNYLIKNNVRVCGLKLFLEKYLKDI